MTAVKFLTSLAEDQAVGLPGRMPGLKNWNVLVLPSSLTHRKNFETYADIVQRSGTQPMSETTFRRAWKTHCPYIVVGRPETDLCWVCHKHKRRSLRAARVHEDIQLANLDSHREHLQHVQAARQHYRQEAARAKDIVTRNGLTRLGRPDMAIEWVHYSFDFAQNVHIPASPLQPGPIYFLTPGKCHIFGICCEGLPKQERGMQDDVSLETLLTGLETDKFHNLTSQVNYIIDEGMLTGKGSNTVISYLHHFFEAHGLGEAAVSLHCDNCSGQNKNRYMMAYLAWRVMVGLHQKIELNFMVAGHTKFSPDLCFGMLKRKYRRGEVHCLDDMCQVVTNSSEVNVPQLVGTEDGTVIVPTFDWQSFLKDFGTIPGIKQLHFFRFSADEPGTVSHSNHIGDPLTQTRLLRGPAPQGLPATIPAPGLSKDKQEYLYSKIREFVQEEKQDITCPAP